MSDQALRDLRTVSAVTGGVGGIIGGSVGGVQGAAIGFVAGGACPATTMGIGVCGLAMAARFLTPEQRQALIPTLRAQGVPEREIEMFLRADVQSPNVSIGLSETGQQVVIEQPGEMVAPTTQTMNPIFQERSQYVVETPFGQLFNLETGEFFHYPSYKKGGLVKRTGLAYVHKGEYVVPVKDVKKCNVCVKN